MTKRVLAQHRGPLDGFVIIEVEPGTEIMKGDEIEIVDDDNAVVSNWGALYVTPSVFQKIKDEFD